MQLGRMVIVPFGRRLRRGWLLGYDGQAPVEAVKPLAAVLAETPPVTAAQAALMRWVSRRTNKGIAAVVATAMPSALLDGCLPRLRLTKAGTEVLAGLDKRAAPLLKHLRAGPVRLDRAGGQVVG